MSKKTICISLSAISLLFGCSTAGLAQIEKTRTDYNQSLTNSEDSQFLLNIIRVHYGFSPYFIGVDSVTSQSSLKGGFDNSDTKLFQSPMSAAPNAQYWSVSPGISYSISPVVTYSPVQGSKFVSALLSPIDIQKLFLLTRSLGVKSVLRIAVEQIGVLENVKSIKSNHKKPLHYREFNQFVEELEDMLEDDEISVEMTSYNSQPAILLYMHDNKAADKMAKLLHLKERHKTIIFTMFVLKHASNSENIVHIQTRSYFNILQFLSNGIRTKKEDNEQYGIDKTFVDSSGKVTDTSNLTKKILTILVSNSEPKNSSLKVEYQGKWYYIADNDNHSKSTLLMLRLVYSLLVGEYQPNLPILTIPVK